MQPDNPLFPPIDNLDKMAGEALRQFERTSREREVLLDLNKAFDGEQAINISGRNNGDSFKNFGSLCASDVSRGLLYQSYPKELATLYTFCPDFSFLPPFETAEVEASPGVVFDSSVFRALFTQKGDQTQKHKVIGLRIDARVIDPTLPDIAAAKPELEEKGVIGLIFTDPNGEHKVFVQDYSGEPDEFKIRAANPIEQENIFDELEKALASMSQPQSDGS